MLRVFDHFFRQGVGWMASAIENRIKAAEERLRRLKAKNARAKARARTALSRSARREDTRRKVLVGAVVLQRIEAGLLEESVLREWLQDALDREEDRALFGLKETAAASE